MVAVAQAATGTARARKTRGWTIVLEQELRDLWLGGRGLLLSLAFSLLLSVIAYLVATNTALNFLEARESVNLTLQVAVAVGGLLALVSAADSRSRARSSWRPSRSGSSRSRSPFPTSGSSAAVSASWATRS